MEKSKANGLEVTTHYEPLHSSVAGKRYGRHLVDLKNTEDLSKRILRLPIHTQISKSDLKCILDILDRTISECLI